METKPYLKSMKSRYFMLVACLTLILGTTACSNENFGTDLPEQEKTYTIDGKTYTKQELIEQAMSRVPMTKVTAGNAIVTMVTISNSVTISRFWSDTLTVSWGDGTNEMISETTFSHTYSNDSPSHLIMIKGSEEFFDCLEIQNNGLIYLEVIAPDLWYLDCSGNMLDQVGLYQCSKLEYINVENNELHSIDLSEFPKLIDLRANNNRLKTIDLSKTPNLSNLEIGGSRITDLDLTQNTALAYVILYDLPLKTINNQPISDTSFYCLPNLFDFDISGTPFTALDISANPRLRTLNIAYSDIEGLTYTETSLRNLKELHVEGTPFENIYGGIRPLVNDLRNWSEPNDWGNIEAGHLYTHSRYLVGITPDLDLVSTLKSKNWLINQ